MVWESAEIKDKPMVADGCFFFDKGLMTGGFDFVFIYLFIFPKRCIKALVF